MQSDIVDKKIKVLYDHYKETPFVRDAQHEVEEIRNSATNWGLGITTGAFVGNELARMSMRSRKFLSLSFTFYSLKFSTLQGSTS